MDDIRYSRLSTIGLTRHDQHELWQEILSSSLYPVRVRPVGLSARPLDAVFHAMGARSSALTRGTIGAVRTDIPPSSATNATGEDLELTLHRDHSRFVATPDDRIVVEAGQLLAQTGDLPSSHQTDLPDESMLMRVPTAPLTLDPITIRHMRMRPLTLPTAAVRVMRSTADHLLEPGLELAADAVEKYLIGVAELLLRSAMGAELDLQETVVARRQQVRDYIDANLHRPDIGPASIAAALHISRRTLYNMFAESPGVAAEITSARIERARSMLADPRRSQWNIGRVARACGFANRSHFSRVFATATGHRPSSYRDLSNAQ